MKKTLSISMALGLAAVLVAGCGRNQKTYVAPGGSVTVKQDKAGDKGTVEIQTKEGTATITTGQKGTVTEKELGVPVYPGATVEAGIKMDAAGKNAGQAYEQHTMTTSDSVEKVAEFYKSKVKGANTMMQNMGDQQMAILTVEKGNMTFAIHVMSDKEKGKTTIMVTKTTK